MWGLADAYDSKTNNPEKIKIPANTEFAVTSIFAPANVFGQTGCRLNVKFLPKEGKSYILETSWKNSCVLRSMFSKMVRRKKFNLIKILFSVNGLGKYSFT